MAFVFAKLQTDDIYLNTMDRASSLVLNGSLRELNCGTQADIISTFKVNIIDFLHRILKNLLSLEIAKTHLKMVQRK